MVAFLFGVQVMAKCRGYTSEPEVCELAALRGESVEQARAHVVALGFVVVGTIAERIAAEDAAELVADGDGA